VFELRSQGVVNRLLTKLELESKTMSIITSGGRSVLSRIKEVYNGICPDGRTCERVAEIGFGLATFAIMWIALASITA